MSTVTVKDKYLVAIPQSIRERIGVNVGDRLEVKTEDGKIVLQPKSAVERGIDQSIKEYKEGRAYGPFHTHEQFLSALHSEQKKIKRKSKRSVR